MSFSFFFYKKMKIKKYFFQRQTDIVAKELLGNILCTYINNELTGGIIVEVESYYGFDDPANHGFKGKTKRNEVIFREGGFIYVYLNYGIHFLLNISTEMRDFPSSVFIRAIEPVYGIEIMKKRRGINNIKNLTNGPAKLTKALGIDKNLNGLSIESDIIFIEKNKNIKDFEIVRAKRIGISKGNDLLRRYYIKNSNFISKK